MIQSYWLGGWKIRGTDMPADAAGPADRATGAELVAPPVAGPPLRGGAIEAFIQPPHRR